MKWGRTQAWSSHHQFLSRCKSIVFTTTVVVSPFFHWQIFCPVSKITEGETKCVNCLWFRNQVACQWIANWLHSTWEPLQEWTCLPKVKIRLSLLLFSYWNEETQKLIFSVQKLLICIVHFDFNEISPTLKCKSSLPRYLHLWDFFGLWI